MNILILHNNSLPIDIVDMARRNDLKNNYTQYDIKQSLTDQDSFDTFVTKKIEEIIKPELYHLVILSFNLSVENHADYSGVTLGLHLRLSKQSYKLPLLFLGKDRPEQVAKLKDLGSLFFTPKVFVSTARTSEELEEYIASNNQYLQELTEEEYRKFLNRIKIGDIENYGPHAIANIWAIKRWQDMLFDSDFSSEISNDPRRCHLMFKYIDQLAQINDARQNFSKARQRVLCMIPDIKGKQIVYIDDEVNKGWGTLIRKICDASSAQLDCWEPGDLKNRDDVKRSIFEFIDNHQEADCYIVDLRLAEEDINESEFEKLTGHMVSRYIKKLNKANQIVVFTASNKVWNLKKEINEIGALGYTLKESPSMNLSREASIQLFHDFTYLVKNAVALSDLKDLVKFQNRIETFYKKLHLRKDEVDLSGIYNNIDLLLLDKHLFDNGKNNICKGKTSREIVKTVILNLCVFIETYMKDRFKTSCSKIEKNNKVAIDQLEHIKTKELYDVLGHLFVRKEDEEIVGVFTNEKALRTEPDKCEFLWRPKYKENDLSIMLAPLYAYYKIGEIKLSMVARFKDIRNSAIAHRGGDIAINYNDIKMYYLDIIDTILSKDYPDIWD